MCIRLRIVSVNGSSRNFTTSCTNICRIVGVGGVAMGWRLAPGLRGTWGGKRAAWLSVGGTGT